MLASQSCYQGHCQSQLSLRLRQGDRQFKACDWNRMEHCLLAIGQPSMLSMQWLHGQCCTALGLHHSGGAAWMMTVSAHTKAQTFLVKTWQTSPLKARLRHRPRWTAILRFDQTTFCFYFYSVWLNTMFLFVCRFCREPWVRRRLQMSDRRISVEPVSSESEVYSRYRIVLL